MEGFCEVNVKRGGPGKVYNRPVMQEIYRPPTEQEAAEWRQKYGVWMFDNEPDTAWQLEGRPEPGQKPEPERKMSVLGFLGLLFLTFLDAIIDLPDYKELGIDGGRENRNASKHDDRRNLDALRR